MTSNDGVVVVLLRIERLDVGQREAQHLVRVGGRKRGRTLRARARASSCNDRRIIPACMRFSRKRDRARRLCISRAMHSAASSASAIIAPAGNDDRAHEHLSAACCCRGGAGAVVLPTAAQVKVGVIVSATGPAASLGIPEKNTVGAVRRSRSAARRSSTSCSTSHPTRRPRCRTRRRLIGEDKVDAIIGTTTTPTTLAILDVIADGETPTISLASSIRIIEPMDAKRAWMFKTPQTDVMMAGAILEHMAEERREDDRLRRLQRRAGRGILRRDRQGGEGAQHPAGRQRALRAQGHERRRAVAEAHRRQAGRRS